MIMNVYTTKHQVQRYTFKRSLRPSPGNLLQGDTEGTADDAWPPLECPQGEAGDEVTQRAAAEAVRLSVKALRMTLQKIGGKGCMLWSMTIDGIDLCA